MATNPVLKYGRLKAVPPKKLSILQQHEEKNTQAFGTFGNIGRSVQRHPRGVRRYPAPSVVRDELLVLRIAPVPVMVQLVVAQPARVPAQIVTVVILFHVFRLSLSLFSDNFVCA